MLAGPTFWVVAQLAERPPVKRVAGGSSPPDPAICGHQLVASSPAVYRVTGVRFPVAAPHPYRRAGTRLQISSCEVRLLVRVPSDRVAKWRGVALQMRRRGFDSRPGLHQHIQPLISRRFPSHTPARTATFADEGSEYGGFYDGD